MIRILFVCLGNICRSPMAECIFLHLAREAGVADAFAVDSAATSREDLGNPIYPPARRQLQSHGVACPDHRARQIQKQDYGRFDYIIAMERSNIRPILAITGGDPEGKVSRLLDHTPQGGDVADPWYTGDFDAAWRDIHAGCTVLLRELRQRHRI